MEMKIDLELLLKTRKNKAWTQAHLAEVCGLSLRTIQRIENNGTASHDSIQALASVFEISVEDLIFKEDESDQKPNEIKKQHIIDKLFSRLGVVLMLVVPAIWFFTLVTGTNLIIDTTNFTHEPSFFYTEKPEKLPASFKLIKGGKRTETSSSTVFLLFGSTHISYYTYLPAVILFCISIGVFANRKRWVRNCLIFSSLIFIFTSSKVSFFVFLPCIILFYILKRMAQKNNWQLNESI